MTRERAAGALRRAVDFYRGEVSAEGGYLWRYSSDLKRREGEGKASPTEVWVQPPGTPAVGQAYLRAYEQCGEGFLLEAAKETAHALVRGQLRSGGWDYRIEFDPERRGRYGYRVVGASDGGFNTSTLDDNTTQSALRCLMRVDAALDFKDATIHEAVAYALGHLMEAQYPNGAWPQRFSAPPDPAKHPVKKASYPEDWSRTYPGKDYQGFYTFNDNTIADMIETMFEAWRIYGKAAYQASAEKGGGFILLSQMPEPQPGWAQQYNADMEPAWARKFEPPAVTGGESFGVMQTLITLARQTGDKAWLKPLPAAIAYFQRSRLADGRFARFYELKTNTPLYFTKDYKLTYDDGDLPTHYSFKGSWDLEGIIEQYESIKDADLRPLGRERMVSRVNMNNGLIARAKAVVDQLDDRGAWVEEGRLRYHGAEDPTRRIIDSSTFAKNIQVLARYLGAADGN
jgi:hypothetical protein